MKYEKPIIAVSYLILFLFVMGGFIFGYEHLVPYELSLLVHPFVGVILFFYLKEGIKE